MKLHWFVLVASISQEIIRKTVKFSYGRFVLDVQESFPGASMAMLMSVISLSICIECGLTPFALFVVRLLKYKNTLLLGAGVSTVGTCLLSMAVNEYQFLMGYAIFSFGGLFILNAGIFLLGHVFPQSSRYHVFATSLNIALQPIGIITVLISNILILSYGWRIAYILWGAVSIFSLMIAAYIYCKQEELDKISDAEENRMTIFELTPEKQESFFEWVANSKRKRALLLLTFMLASCSKAMFGNSAAFILVKHGVTLGFSKTASSALVLYMGLSELILRLTTAIIGDRYLRGHFIQMYIAGMVAGSVVNFSLGYTARNYNEMVIYALAVGFCLGPIMAGCYPICGEIFPGRYIDDAYAIYCLCFGIGVTAGLVIDAYIYDITGEFYNAFLVNGCLHMFSATMYCIISGLVK